MSATGIPGILLAYDVSENIVAYLEYLVWHDPQGQPHLVNFEAHEAVGGRLRDVWYVPGAVGSGSWPEYLPPESLEDFRVELDHAHPLRIRRLRHKRSGHVRARADIVAEVARRREEAVRAIAREANLPDDVRLEFDVPPEIDVRDLVGGLGKPLALDKDGRDAKKRPTRPWLMVPRIGPQRGPTESTGEPAEAPVKVPANKVEEFLRK